MVQNCFNDEILQNDPHLLSKQLKHQDIAIQMESKKSKQGSGQNTNLTFYSAPKVKKDEDQKSSN